MAAPAESPRRRVLVFLTCVLAMAILTFVGVAAVVVRSQGPGARPGTESIRLLALVAGFAALGTAFFLAPRAAGGAGPAPSTSPAAVHVSAFRALVVSEAGAVFGFVGTYLTNRLEIVLILGAGALAANFLWILPQGLRRLAEVEAQPAGTGAA